MTPFTFRTIEAFVKQLEDEAAELDRLRMLDDPTANNGNVDGYRNGKADALRETAMTIRHSNIGIVIPA